MIFNYKRGPIYITEILGKRENNVLKYHKSDVIQSLELQLTNPGILIKKIDKYSFEMNIPNYIINLKQDEEEIFRNVHKSTRADIRKAINKDKVNYIEVERPTDEQIKEFTDLYNSFAREKNIAQCNVKKLAAIREHDCLIYTYITADNNQILCASMLFQDHSNRQLYGMYGVSNRSIQMTQKDKNFVSRANKLLQWREILLAKEKGLDWYNFGGEVSMDAQGVNDFKRRFGTISAYDRRIYTSNSFLGKFAILFLYEKWKKNLQTNRSRENVLKPNRVVD